MLVDVVVYNWRLYDLIRIGAISYGNNVTCAKMLSYSQFDIPH